MQLSETQSDENEDEGKRDDTWKNDRIYFENEGSEKRKSAKKMKSKNHAQKAQGNEKVNESENMNHWKKNVETNEKKTQSDLENKDLDLS